MATGEASDPLAQTYLAALNDRDEAGADRLAASIPLVTELLSHDPSAKGESREGYDCVMFVGPITITVRYEVIHDDMLVVILDLVIRTSR